VASLHWITSSAQITEEVELRGFRQSMLDQALAVFVEGGNASYLPHHAAVNCLARFGRQHRILFLDDGQAIEINGDDSRLVYSP
jgi:hypothetical protein